MVVTAHNIHSKQGYKQTKVGLIPEEWEAVLLGEVIQFQRGFDLSHQKRQLGHVPVVSSSGISGRHSEAKVSGPGIVTGRYGTIGQIFFINEDFWPLNTTLFVKDFKGNDPLFISFLLLTVNFQIYSDKSGVPGVNRNDLHQIVVILPPLPEQRAIAAALSDADALIASLDKLIAKKWDIKQATMQRLLTGKTRLPGFSGEWEVKELGDIFSITAGQSKSEFIQNGGKYFIADMGSVSTSGQLIATKQTNFAGDFLDFGDLVMPKDDIGGGNIIGRVAFINQDKKYILGDHVYKLKLIALEGDSLFLAYLINSHTINISLRKKVSGSAQLGLNRQSIEKQSIVFPTKPEQQAIATILTDMDAEIVELEERREKTRALKQGMMQELLTGKTRLLA